MPVPTEMDETELTLKEQKQGIMEEEYRGLDPLKFLRETVSSQEEMLKETETMEGEPAPKLNLMHLM